MYYILENQKLKRTNDILEWGQWMEEASRTIAISEFGNVHISTVFLGIDHGFSFSDKEPLKNPIIFETMIFDQSQFTMRYRTIGAALDGHEKILLAVLNEENPKDIEWDR